ncbi:MAG: protein kinase domain-containing protein [Marinicella pacifica]
MSDLSRQIRQLFDLCIDLPTKEQVAFIQAADFPQTVKQKVLRLLKHQNSDLDISGQLLDAVKSGLRIEDLKKGDVLNEFELIKLIGRGGQGDVWLARRVDGQFEQQVAVKILKPIYQQREEQRFLAERSLLAQLSHPHIAQLISGGHYADKRHYMVLEWVDGSDLLAYAQQHSLALKKRLRLFMQVCEAVAYAHQNGIIHRDIKPSNVMVDKNGVVKLLDFGVAKSKDINITETQHDQMLTMAYASPEQLKGEKVSTVTDVYSLGLLLYELLTGQKAHAVDNTSPAELIDSITSQMPTSPSERLNQGVHRVLNTKIDKELDYLVLMALRKEPERRYQTVNAMLQDLKNYLDHKPLIAGGDSWWYRSKKFLLRNPVATTMGILLLVAMVFLQVSLVDFNRQLSEQRDQALSAQVEAERQAELANQTRDFLLNILEAASPLGNQGKDIRLDDVLAIGEKQIINSLNNEPEVKTELLKTFGSIQHNLGHYQNAIDYYQNAYELALSQDMFDQAILSQAQMALNAAWLSEYELAKKHLKIGDELLPMINDTQQKAWYQIIKSTVITEIGEQEAGLTLAQQVLKSVQIADIEDPELLGRIHNELGVSYSRIDNLKSYQHHRQALQLARQVFGDYYPKTYDRMINTATSLQRIERYREADLLFAEAQKVGQLIYPEGHPSLGRFIAERAVHFHDRGAFDQALKLYQQALDLTIQNSGKNSEEYAVRLNNLGYLYEDLGEYQKAIGMYRESIQIRKKLLGEDSLSVASARSNLARVLAKDKQFEQASVISDLVMPVYEAHERGNFYNEVTLWAIKIHQSHANKCQSVLSDMQPFLQKLTEQSDGSWRRLGAEFWLGQAFYQCGRFDLAKTLLESVLRINDKVYLADSYGHKMIQSKAKQLLADIDGRSV